MTKQITLEEALKLVEFRKVNGKWFIQNVKDEVCGNVCGLVHGNVGDVYGNVRGKAY